MLTLSEALISGSSLHDQIVTGIGSVKKSDRKLIDPSVRPLFGDGVDLDAATAAEFPQAHRWDYVLSIPSKDKLIGIEPHSASDGEVRVVIKKKQNAQGFLRSHLKPKHSVAEWHWVTRGKVGFSRMDPVVRALNQNGIRFAGRSLRAV
jgi:hypothetical protein